LLFIISQAKSGERRKKGGERRKKGGEWELLRLENNKNDRIAENPWTPTVCINIYGDGCPGYLQDFWNTLRMLHF